jgi:hypothetical protein
MNEIIKKLSAEFEKMENIIAFQNQVIASTQHTPVCPCGRMAAVQPDIPKLRLNDCSWEEISMYAQSGMAERVFVPGDTKKITLKDGSEINVRIIDFNHDEDESGQKIPISFESVETLNEDQVMNDSCSNKGGWEKSKLRSFLNTTILAMLPDDLRAVIKPCVKLTRTSGASNASLGKTLDHIFVLSEQEIFGRKIYSGGNEGHWYDWYRQENTEYGKCKQNGERDWRWERSPRRDSTASFCLVDRNGSADRYYASYTCGVSFGFCV